MEYNPQVILESFKTKDEYVDFLRVILKEYRGLDQDQRDKLTEFITPGKVLVKERYVLRQGYKKDTLDKYFDRDVT
jgi:hypothetical protein